MRKTDKKRDNAIRKVLTEVCDSALKDINDFRWLTHSVNYDRFPQSLTIHCIFETEQGRQHVMESEDKIKLISLIEAHLRALDVQFKQIDKHVLFDSEQACKTEHQGNWAKRLSTH